MIKDALTFTASDGMKLALHRWLPDDRPVGLIQIAHGMMEFAQRYDSFAERAVGLGYAVIANDARGHGMTAGTLESLGRLGEGDTFSRCVEDLYEITQYARDAWPAIPVILFGHSWGSFLAQMYIERHGAALSACILSGTRGPDPLEVFGGRTLAGLLGALGRGNTRSRLLFNLSFRPCNARVPNPQSPNAWLSSDGEAVALYDASPWCGFLPTVRFWDFLMTGLSAIHKRAAFEAIPKNLPVLLFAGSDDPIGKYGKTIDKLVMAYRDAGMTDVERKTYGGARHETLNDSCRDRVMSDLFAWIALRLSPRG